MQILLTGATGSIGSGVLQALIEAGHSITCPVRSLSKVTAPPHPLVTFIELDSSKPDYEKFFSIATNFPCIIHTGYFMTAADDELERTVTSALLDAAKSLSQSQKVIFIFTSGAGVLGHSDHVTRESELSSANSFEFCKTRVAHEELVLSAASENLVVSVVRPVWIYGGSFVDFWFASCKRLGKIVLPNETGRMTFVHKEDLGRIYRLIVEQECRGCFIGSEGEGPSMEDLIELAKKVTGVEVVERVDNIFQHLAEFGFMLLGLGLTAVYDCTRAREELGFIPKYNLLRDAETALKLN